MTALIVIGWIAAYLTVGAVYARSQAVAIYRRHLRAWSGSTEPVFVAGAFVVHVLFWPFVAATRLVSATLGKWLMQPIADRQDRAEQLRKDAAAWRDKRHSGTPAEREMAAELARLCEQQAREVDL